MSFPKALFSLFLLTACGYRWHYDYPELGVRPKMFIPFIQDDADCALTGEIIAALQTSGLVDIASQGAEYRLNVKPLYNRHDQIGYRRDPQKINGQKKKNLLASEGRTTFEVEVTITREKGSEIAFGPYTIRADSEYDYVDGDSLKDLAFINKEGELIEVLPFSLGQLESIEFAQEASSKPLYRNLARKIVDLLSSEW